MKNKENRLERYGAKSFFHQPNPETQGRSINILLLIVPLVTISWGFYENVKLPLNQLEFFESTFVWAVTSYAFVWVLSYLGKKIVSTTLFLTAFTFFAWFLGVLLSTAVINQKFDSSAGSTFYRLILRKHQSLGSSGANRSSPSCTVWFNRPIQNAEYGPLKYSECDLATIDQDGIMYKTHAGSLGFLWIEDHWVIKDYRTYMQRLQLTEDPK
jgi:hypothetical protein